MRFIFLILGVWLSCQVSLIEAYAEEDDLGPVTYFLIDASGSMKEEVPRAKEILAARMALLADQNRKSITYFGGKSPLTDQPIRCEDKVLVSDAVPRDAAIPDFPTLGDKEDKTSIGQGLTAVLEQTAGNSLIVLLTDGSEECNSDFLAIRHRFPKAQIEVYQVGGNPNSALRLLEIQPITENSSQAILAEPLPISLELVPAEPPVEVGWLARLIWILVLLISAVSATLFCLQSGERSKDLRDQLAELDEKTPADLKVIYTSHETTNGKRKRIPDRKRFKIYWLKNRDDQLSYGSWGVLLFFVAVAGLLALTFPEFGALLKFEPLSRDIRRDCWSFLSSNIGAVSFAGTVLSLAGFSAFQWWQTFEAKKELLIASGTIKSERREAERRKYESKRTTVLSDQFSLPKISIGWWADEEIEIHGFDVLQQRLRNLAAPEFDDATQKQKRDIDKFLKIKSMVTFAKLLEEVGILEPRQANSVEQMIAHATNEEDEEATAISNSLIAQLTPPADDTSES